MVSKRYYSCLNGGKIWRLHINMYEEFRSRLRICGYKDEVLEIIDEPFGEHVTVEYNRNEAMQDRGKQADIIQYIARTATHDTSMLGSQTGKGKSYMAFRIAEERQERIIMFMKNQFIDKWVIDFQKMFTDSVKTSVLRLDEGRGKLKRHLMDVHLGKTNPKVIIIPIRTMSIWIKEYEKRGRAILDEFPCLPDELFNYTKSGMRVIDEVGLEFHANFQLDLYTHAKRCLSMDATLFDDDPKKDKMFRLAYPKEVRVDANIEDWDKYISVMALHFNFFSPEKIRTKEHNGINYSHNAVEDSIINNRRCLPNYFDMVARLLLKPFDKMHHPGAKGLIYFYKIEMCEAFRLHLLRMRPELKVMTYHGKSGTLEEAHASDVIVTTVGKTGVGADLPGLVVTVMTNNLQATDTNIQVMGRLRKNELAESLLFIYLVADNVPKYLEYHEKKKPILQRIAKEFSEASYPEYI